MNVLFHIALLTHFGVTGSLLLDPSAEYEGVTQSGSLVMQLLQGGSGLLSIAIVFGSPDGKALFKKSLPLFMLAGFALLSALWSIDPYLTVRRSINLTITFFLGLALVVRLGPVGAVQLVVRAMSIACVLSVLTVIFDPALGVHGADDAFQNVHAGLWRGLLAHKVSLGMFSGLCLALLVVYGPSSFSNPGSWFVAVLSAASCLIGSGSATGIVSMALLGSLIFVSTRVEGRSVTMRRRTVMAINMGLLIFATLIYTGTLDRFASYLGRSADLTGRATYWPHVEAFMNANAYYLGYGYGAGFRFVGPLIEQAASMRLTEAHNGILELIVGVGHIGMFAIMAAYVWFVWRASQVLIDGGSHLTRVKFFPYALLATLFVVSYAESIILTFNGVWSILFSLALAILHHQELGAVKSASHVDCEMPVEA